MMTLLRRCSGLWNPDRGSRDVLDFLPAALAIQQRPPSPASRWLLWSLVVLLVGGLLWLSLSRVDVVVAAPGTIMTQARIKTINPYQKGVVERLLVDNGDKVKEGQALVELGTALTESDVKDLQEQLANAVTGIQRREQLLKLIQEDRRPSTAALSDAEPLLQAEWRNYLANTELLQQEQAAQQAELKASKVGVERLSQTLPFITERANAAQGLLSKGYVSRAEYLKLEEQRIDQSHQLQTEKVRQLEVEATLAKTRQQLAVFQSDFKRQLLQNLKDLKVQQSTLQEKLHQAITLNARQILRSPVDGVVQELAIHTVGGVVTEAQPLMKIVPSHVPLEVTATLQNQDIGFVKIGQQAEIKVQAFPYTEYGVIPAQVVDISDAAVPDEKEGWVYTLRLQLERNTIQVNGAAIPLRPGMIITADIKTGTRRLLAYFLSPVLKTSQESFRER